MRERVGSSWLPQRVLPAVLALLRVVSVDRAFPGPVLTPLLLKLLALTPVRLMRPEHLAQRKLK